MKPVIEGIARRRRMKPHDYLMHYLLKEHKPGQPYPWEALGQKTETLKGKGI